MRRLAGFAIVGVAVFCLSGGADQPGVFVPPTMLVLSSQAGRFREQVAGPRDCDADGPCCSESAIVR
jgi:hypothetical protein